MLLLLFLLTSTTGFICQRTKFPYYISLLAPLPYVDNCLLYEERRECNGNDLSIQIGKYDGSVRVTLSSSSLGISATDTFKNEKGPVDDIDSITVEILWDTVIIYDDFVPVSQIILKNENMTVPILQCTNVVQSNGNCRTQPCKVLTCNQQTDFASSKCMFKKLPVCADNTGFCHGGKCKKSDFGEQCQCEKKGLLRGNYLGEFCSIKSDELYRTYSLRVHSFDVELDFVSSKVVMGVTSVFENFAYTTVIANLYELPMFTLIETQTINSESGDMTILFPVSSNTSYVIKFCGQFMMTALPVRSFYHFTEIHTPGYSLLPPPTNLTFSFTPTSLTLITWSNPNSKDVKLTYFTSLKNESVTTSRNVAELSLASRTNYTVIAQSLNHVDEEGPESVPLTFETPYFLHDLHSHGSFNFATWLFRKSTVTVNHLIINFKNTIRRDVRVKEVAIILYKGTVPVYDTNLVYQTIIYNTSFNDHQPGGSYITAKFGNQSIPKSLLLGDGLVYNDFVNGPLEMATVYQVYIVLWYVAGNEDQISLQYVGEVNEPVTPWLVYVSAVLCGISIILLTSTLINNLFSKKELLTAASTMVSRGSNACPSSLTVIEAVYSEALLDASYVFNKPVVGIVEHTFSAVDTKK